MRQVAQLVACRPRLPSRQGASAPSPHSRPAACPPSRRPSRRSWPLPRAAQGAVHPASPRVGAARCTTEATFLNGLAPRSARSEPVPEAASSPRAEARIARSLASYQPRDLPPQQRHRPPRLQGPLMRHDRALPHRATNGVCSAWPRTRHTCAPSSRSHGARAVGLSSANSRPAGRRSSRLAAVNRRRRTTAASMDGPLLPGVAASP